MTTSLHRFLPAALAWAIAATPVPAFGDSSVNPSTVANRARGIAVERTGDLPLGAIFRTDERYNNGSLFSGPRGWDYWNTLPAPQGYQNPNLWPDKRPTYLFGEIVLPAGTELTVRGRFPHVRFFNFSIYQWERNTFVGADGGSIDGYDIEPDAGSTNPFVAGADRNATKRDFTIRILTREAPANAADRARNTVYLGNKDQTILGGFRMYVSDKGHDGTGWGPADVPSRVGPGVTYEATLADGSKLSQEEATRRFGKIMGEAPPPINADVWYKLVNNPHNNPCMTPATAPACPDSQFFLFTGMRDVVEGAFMPPAERAKIPVPRSTGGGANASTAYLVNFTSRAFGPLYVIRAKKPSFPDTWANAKTMPGGDVQYWSVSTVASFTNGSLWDGVFDMQVPVDKDGYYTIVVSLPEDRPQNATDRDGVAWVNWGPGEGIGDPRNRKDWGALLMRFMVPSKDWQQSPLKHGELATVMGPYYPKGYYTTREEFEKNGVRK
jgi:hypothetical protein